MEISIQPCVFGYALIGTTWKNRLMAVEIGASLEDVMGAFINHWNTTRLSDSLIITKDRSPDPKIVQSVLKTINEGVQPDIDVVRNMSLSGTYFQRKVWMSLLEIPLGKTETYQQVAARLNEKVDTIISSAAAARAVGNAIGVNPVAIIVPCHRVVRSDGSLGGYRWGEDIKKKLLEREHVT